MIRSLSDPGGLNKLCQPAGLVPSSKKISVQFQLNQLLKHGPNIPGQREDQLKAKETSGDDVLYAAEEEIWNSSDMNSQDKRRLVDFMHSKNRLMKANASLQMALNTCEDSNIGLQNEIIQLKNQIQSMKQVIRESGNVRVEIDEVHAALAESHKSSQFLKASNNQLEKENKKLSDQIEAITQEISDILPEREAKRKTIINLSQHIQAVQQDVMEAKVLLDQKDEIITNKDKIINQHKASVEELTNIGQGLRERIKELEKQLELAVVNEGGSVMFSNGSLSVATRNRLSLAQELGLMTGFQREDAEGADFEDANLQIHSEARHKEMEKQECAGIKQDKQQAQEKVFVPEQNSSKWLDEKICEKIKRGALITGAIGLGAFLLWKMKS